jgi:hypothetical protein
LAVSPDGVCLAGLRQAIFLLRKVHFLQSGARGAFAVCLNAWIAWNILLPQKALCLSQTYWLAVDRESGDADL